MRSLFAVALMCCWLAIVAGAQTAATIGVMPMPAKVTVEDGYLAIDRSFSVAVTGRTDTHLQRAVEHVLESLRAQTVMLLLDGKPTDATKVFFNVRSDTENKEVQE